jgi:small subunit ribosomal protein S5
MAKAEENIQEEVKEIEDMIEETVIEEKIVPQVAETEADVKQEEAKAEEIKVEEVKVEEVKAEEVKPPEKIKLSIAGNIRAKTELGKKVIAGEITDISKIFSEGMKISEPFIVDALLPNLEKEIILIGGSTGKGGGIRRTPFKRTSRMHKSGRRYKISVMTVIGNKNGYVGVGFAGGPAGKNQEVMEKSLNKAKLSIVPIRRGCGSWECSCGSNHSIPFSVMGRSGSVKLKLLPAPKGVGLAVSDEVKKLLRLAGIHDIWSKSEGNTQMRTNLIMATFDALKKLNAVKVNTEFEQKSGMSMGKC